MSGPVLTPSVRYTLDPGGFDADGFTNQFQFTYSTDAESVGAHQLYYSSEVGVGPCRDQFSYTPLWWRGPHGIIQFDLHPPQLFIGFETGRNSGAAKAKFETTPPDVDATDGAGYTYRFGGRFLAYCRNFDSKIGGLIVESQFLATLGPIDLPRLISTGSSGGPCGDITNVIYDPYSESSEDCSNIGSGTQYEPGQSTGGETVDWGSGTGNGGSSACGDSAVMEYVCIDIWNGEQWVEWACGYATVC